MEEKIADHANSGATRQSRFVPYASELIRGKPHMDETLELQYGVYELDGTWSAQASELLDAAKAMHEVCIRAYKMGLVRSFGMQIKILTLSNRSAIAYMSPS